MKGLMIVVIILVIVAIPVLVIWSLNTLFGLMIPFTFQTWIAALILAGVFSHTSRSRP